MPPRLAPTGRSSSRSSKRSEPAPAPTGAVVAVGEIVGAHALRGWLRLRAYQPPAPSLVPGRRVLIAQGGACRELEVRSAAPHGRGLVLLALAGVDDRGAAEALVGARVLVRTTDLPPPAEDEFYYHEVVGFRVETTGGESLGAVAETFPTGLNDVGVGRGGGRAPLLARVARVVAAVGRAPRPARSAGRPVQRRAGARPRTRAGAAPDLPALRRRGRARDRLRGRGALDRRLRAHGRRDGGAGGDGRGGTAPPGRGRQPGVAGRGLLRRGPARAPAVHPTRGVPRRARAGRAARRRPRRDRALAPRGVAAHDARAPPRSPRARAARRRGPRLPPPARVARWLTSTWRSSITPSTTRTAPW